MHTIALDHLPVAHSHQYDSQLSTKSLKSSSESYTRTPSIPHGGTMRSPTVALSTIKTPLNAPTPSEHAAARFEHLRLSTYKAVWYLKSAPKDYGRHNVNRPSRWRFLFPKVRDRKHRWQVVHYVIDYLCSIITSMRGIYGWEVHIPIYLHLYGPMSR